LPALDHLAQQKASPQQPLKATRVDDALGLLENLVGVRRQQVAWLMLQFAKMLRKALVLTRGQQVWRRPSLPRNQRGSQKQDRLAVR
jgi:hypothetical protein